jgi:hypothetical protein
MLRRTPFAAIALLTLLVPAARADLPQARLDRVAPLGGGAGTEVVVDIAGRDLDDAKALRFDHPGLVASFVKENQFRVRIAPETPEGSYEVRAVGRFGVSNARLFEVSRGLAEVREAEPNDEPKRAQAVPIEVAICGDSDDGGEDVFRFPARRGRRYTLECRALRLDSTMRPVLSVATADGKELARGRPGYGRNDPRIDFEPPADGEYLARVHDLTFAGGQAYRLLITTRPYLDAAFPPVLAVGKAGEVVVSGRNLPGGGSPLRTVTLSVPAPPSTARPWGALIDLLPAASLDARGVQVRPVALEHAPDPLTLGLVADPIVVEREPNDAADKAQAIKMPAVVCGRFDRPGDVDGFAIEAKANEVVAVDLLGDRLGLPLDARVVVLDANGGEVATIDDHGQNPGTITLASRDPQGTFTAPADGKYRLVVQETYGRGGPSFAYAMRVGPPAPDFAPVAFHETTNNPSYPLVRRGGRAFCEVLMNRRDGFDGPATIAAEGLPAGVSCPEVHVDPRAEVADVVFIAAPDAADWEGPIRLVARATIAGQPVTRELSWAQRRWPDSVSSNASRASRAIWLAVRPDAPYALTLPDRPVEVKAGESFETKVSLRRRSADVRGRVQLGPLNPPGGFDVPTVEVAEGSDEAALKVGVAADVPAGTYTLILRGDAQVPFSADPKAAEKPDVRVADPTTPLTVVVKAAAGG